MAGAGGDSAVVAARHEAALSEIVQRLWSGVAYTDAQGADPLFGRLMRERGEIFRLALEALKPTEEREQDARDAHYALSEGPPLRIVLPEENMSLHFKEVCSCGAVIRQCRCPGQKTETVLQEGCPACLQAKAQRLRLGADGAGGIGKPTA